MDLASVRCVILNRDDADGHAIDSGRRTRLMGSGGHREITVNVEQVTGYVDWDNSVYQAILLWEMTHVSRPTICFDIALSLSMTFPAVPLIG
jgi:hypothetical protein